MANLELKATEDNFLKTLKDDAIGRNKELFRFLSLLDSINENTVIALDGDWGCGKTFFVNQAKMLLDSCNSLSKEENTINKEELKSMLSTYNCELSQQQVAVYYDAWSNDNDEDPLLSLIYNISISIQSYYDFKEYSVDFKGLVLSIADAITGRSIKDIVNNIKSENILDGLDKNKLLRDTVNEFFDDIIVEHGDRLVVFIDELDRCKPDFAVRLLERIKHYCIDDRITFVIAINSNELRHTINKFYGENFDSNKYLNRFFDLRVNIPTPDMDKFFAYIGFGDSLSQVDKTMRKVIYKYHFSLRDTARYIRIVNIAVYKITHNQKSTMFPEDSSMSFIAIYIIPIIVGLRMNNADLYNEFINGNQYYPLYDLFVDEEIYWGSMFNKLLSDNETFDKNHSDSKIYVDFKERVQKLYDLLFKKDMKIESIDRVGEIVINKKVRNFISSSISLLSDFSDFSK